MEFLVTRLGKIYPEWDPSEISHQNSLDQEVARLSSSLRQDGISPDSFIKDLHLVALFLELVSVQDLR